MHETDLQGWFGKLFKCLWAGMIRWERLLRKSEGVILIRMKWNRINLKEEKKRKEKKKKEKKRKEKKWKEIKCGVESVWKIHVVCADFKIPLAKLFSASASIPLSLWLSLLISMWCFLSDSIYQLIYLSTSVYVKSISCIAIGYSSIHLSIKVISFPSHRLHNKGVGFRQHSVWLWVPFQVRVCHRRCRRGS